MSITVYPWSKPGKASEAPPEFGDCCGLRPLIITWKKDKFSVGVECQNPKCENSRGVLACDVDILEKWEKCRKGTMPSKYQTIANTVDPCPDCYPITEWEQMTDEELQAADLDPRNLPGPPAKIWEVSYPWLIIKCAGCGGILAEFDAAERDS